MSYLLNYASSFKSPDIMKDINDMYEDDAQCVRNSFEDKGLCYTMAMACVMFLSTIKAFMLFSKDASKPKMTSQTYPMVRLDTEMARSLAEEYERDDVHLSPILSIRESHNINKDSYQPNNIIKDRVSTDIILLRDYLYEHDLTLHATTIKTINHRNVSENDLLTYMHTGSITKPYSTSYITFGEEVNRLLKNALNNKIDLRTNRITQESYIVIKNEEFGTIKEELRKLYIEQIKVKFD